MLDCDSVTEGKHTMDDPNLQATTETSVLVSDPEQNQEITLTVAKSFEDTPASDRTSASPFWRSEIRVIEGMEEVPSLISEVEVLQPFSMNNDMTTDKIKETKIPDQDQNNHCPIRQKVDALHSKIQDLKKGQMVLSNEVKAVNGDQFLSSSGVVSALGHLSSEHETLMSEHENLRKKYVEEVLERRRLYNEVIELKGNIRVFCRCRPLNHGEIESGTSSVVEVDSSRETELQMICSDSSKKQFKFDHVFGPESNQEAVFAQTSPVVISVLDGFNVCIFAYGQTGTGKTFTMEGVPGNRGVNYRTLEELFRLSKERCSTMKYELLVSMLEVYNEKIRDLLIENSTQPSKKLEIKQVAEGTLEIPGLVEARVYSTDEVWELLKTGTQNRAVGSTNANELSSRSHCLFRVTVKGENLVTGQRTRSHLWLVDLAGSERVGRIDVDGERLKESQFINKSLSALGDVISALASKTPHIPYRNSKLTHLLQSSLGGDCKALMFVQISPSAEDLGETLCSLNFASRVRGIEHGPARKQADPTEHFKFKQMVEKLKQEEKERKRLQESLRLLQVKFAHRDELCRTQQEKMRDLENQLAEERKARLQQEARTSAAAAAAAATKPSALPSLPAQKVQSVKKPPLGPSRPREPLRRITNFLAPPRSPLPVRKVSIALPSSGPQTEKENDSEISARDNNKVLMRPRRVSIAVHRPTETTQANNQPRSKRQRVSLATLRPDSQLLSAMYQANTSTVQMQSGGTMARRLFANDPRRKSRIFSPLPELTSSGAAVEATPVGASKFMRSPRRQQQVGSWKPSHPTTVALQRRLANSEDTAEATPTVCRSKVSGSPEQQADPWKLKQPMALALQRRPVVWSPLRQKIQKKERKSLPPSRLGQNCWQ